MWEVRDGTVTEWQIDPRRHGLDCDDLAGLAGGEPAENAERIERLLAGGDGAPAVRCAVLLNAAAGTLCFRERLDVRGSRASGRRHALESGAGLEVLERLRTRGAAR